MATSLGLIVLSIRIFCTFTSPIYNHLSDIAYRDSLDLGYLQADEDAAMDEIDYEALKNAPRITPGMSSTNPECASEQGVNGAAAEADVEAEGEQK